MPGKHGRPISAGPGRIDASERAYRSLRSAILLGELAEGTRLAEAALGEELSLSRTPVRAALARLRSEGLVSAAGAKGMVITPNSRISAAEPQAIMLDLNMRVAAIATTALDESHVAELRLLNRTLPDDADVPALLDWEADFHIAMAELVDRPRISAMLADLAGIQRALAPAPAGHPARRHHLIGQHDELLEAIVAADSEWTATSMRSHGATLASLLSAVGA